MAQNAGGEGAGQTQSVLPRHIAIIMDGNNRWARQHKQRGLAGHRAGSNAARDIVEACGKRGVEHLTLFVFSSENWSRPKREVNGLMALFISVLQKDEITRLHEHNVRLRFIGNRHRFSDRLLRLMTQAETMTADNTGLTVNIAADYGGQWDIVQAARKISSRVADGELSVDDIDTEVFGQAMCLADSPLPDLCIRTGGEHRISNFLLWQFAYTELYFTETWWPDFDESELELALQDFAGRQRRFGKVSEQVASEQPASEQPDSNRPD